MGIPQSNRIDTSLTKGYCPDLVTIAWYTFDSEVGTAGIPSGFVVFCIGY